LKRPASSQFSWIKGRAIDYAKNRACFRSGEIRILDSTGNVQRTIHFTEAHRKL
jgi:hypothetical protein